MTEVVAQDDTVTRLLFSFYLCRRLTSPNYAESEKSSNTYMYDR